MLPQFVEYLDVFATDERFFVFASASVVIALALLFFLPNSCKLTRILLLSAALLLVFAFVVVAPLAAISIAESTPEVNPVKLNFNFGFLALGMGLFLKFRKLPTAPRDDSSQ